MAAAAGSSISMQSRPRLAATRISSLKSFSFPSQRSFLSFRVQPVPASRLRISCAAQPETVEKVCQIVKKQLALAPEGVVTGELKFTTLGADFFDTVEIVMGLGGEFDIRVEEGSAPSLPTVQGGGDFFEKLVEKKGG
uniref:Plastid acyl carrier protein n=1 Tax=Jatropha curcas TaxID=180498 RepID=E2CXJ1_JATCU|nr:plastid acyl carrier protein [Jatropha curcas]